MIIFVSYDITDPRRLRYMHRFLKEFGLNSQKSVFECDIDEEGLKKIRSYCKRNLDIDKDSVLIYKICAGCQKKVFVSGQGIRVTQLEYLVV